MTTKRDSIVVYRSFYEAAKALTDKEELELYRAIFEFGLDHKNAEMGPMAAAMFKLIKPQLEANYKKWQNGMRGGRPKQEESKDKPKDNQKETKDEPNENVNVNDNDNANVFIGLELNDKSLFPIFDDDLVNGEIFIRQLMLSKSCAIWLVGSMATLRSAKLNLGSRSLLIPGCLKNRIKAEEGKCLVRSLDLIY